MSQSPPDPTGLDAGVPGAAQHPDVARLRRRTLAVLSVGQVLGGLGVGAAVSVGAVAATSLAGEAWSGLAATVMTLGAATLAIPLARVAGRSGRRVSLSGAALIAAAGSLVCVLALALGVAGALFAGLGLLGAATAGGLQSRFAAVDLASASTRGRDLSLVVWSTTIGAVTGPNLTGPGNALGAAFGLPPLAGVFLFPVATQLLAACAYFVLLRPDPLMESRRLARVTEAKPAALAASGVGNVVVVRVAIATVSLSHGTMVALMAMTPVHLVHGGAALSVVGFTISLHIAGMYSLSPLFGFLADRFGRFPTIVLGQVMLGAAAVVTALGSEHTRLVIIGLILLGLGWSASTVAGSALLSDAAPPALRVRLQGRSDLAMNFSGALGGAVAGPLLANLGYAGLAWTLLAPVAVVLFAGSLGIRTSGSLRARSGSAVGPR